MEKKELYKILVWTSTGERNHEMKVYGYKEKAEAWNDLYDYIEKMREMTGVPCDGSVYEMTAEEIDHKTPLVEKDEWKEYVKSMKKRELLEGMGIEVTAGSMATKKAWLEKAYSYYMKKDDKELARKYIMQFIKK